MLNESGRVLAASSDSDWDTLIARQARHDDDSEDDGGESINRIVSARGYDAALMVSSRELLGRSGGAVGGSGLTEAETVAQSPADLLDDINFQQRDWNDQYQTLFETRHASPAKELERVSE